MTERGRAADDEAPAQRRKRGRPLDPALDDSALAAAVELLAERGYAGLRVSDVAQRAGSGLGALYRRWPTKRDLVQAALEQVVPDRHLPITEDARADLLAGWAAISAAVAGPRGRLLGALLPELADDPELADTLRRTVLAGVREESRKRLHRIVGDAPDLETRADLAPAYVLFQGVFLGRQVTDDELGMLLDLVVGEPDRGGSE